MKDLSLHILDIVQNSISAGACCIVVDISEDTSANKYTITITDDGRGMSSEVLQRVTDPYYTSRNTRKVGMGIPLFKQNAEVAGGSFSIESEPGNGTKVTASFKHDHIDRPPAGDIAGVMVLLTGANPELNFIYRHTKDNDLYVFDTIEVKQALEDMPVNDARVLKYLKEMIRENLAMIKAI
jgi:anti-sigma regulatory factor (Ser/Thr protein kinase)